MRSDSKRSAFGRLVSDKLTASSMTQRDLSERTGLSQPYVNQVITGARRPDASWADLVADTLKLPRKDRAELHRAAAKDHGFKLDLK